MKEVIRLVFFTNRSETADLKILIADSSLFAESLIYINTTSLWQNKTLPDISKQLLELLASNTATTSEWIDKAVGVFMPSDTIVVMNKVDLLPSLRDELNAAVYGNKTHVADEIPICWMSCKTGEGVEQFMQQFKSLLEIM